MEGDFTLDGELYLSRGGAGHFNARRAESSSCAHADGEYVRYTMKRNERMNIPEQVLDLIRAHSPQEVPPGLSALADAARALHGDSVRAVLFYGSCLRTGNIHDGLVDLYLLVDDYRAAFKSRTLAILNRLMPPNVFYLEIPFEGQTAAVQVCRPHAGGLPQGDGALVPLLPLGPVLSEVRLDLRSG